MPTRSWLLPAPSQAARRCSCRAREPLCHPRGGEGTTPHFSRIWLNAALVHTCAAPQMLIAPAALDSSLPPPPRLRTPALPPYASPGINQRAREAFDLWCAPASSSEHRRTPGSYERARTAGTEEGSERILATPGTSSSPSSSADARHPRAWSGPHAASLAPLSSSPTAQEQTWVAATEEQGCGEQRNDTSKNNPNCPQVTRERGQLFHQWSSTNVHRRCCAPQKGK